MKVFIHLLVDTGAYDDPERLLDNIIALCEEDGLKIIWFKQKETE